MSVNCIPENCNTLNAYLYFKSSKAAIAWYAKVFDAKVADLLQWPNSDKIMHAALKIGNSTLMMSDEMAEHGSVSAETLGKSPAMLMMYVDNVDKVFERACNNGAIAQMPVTDMFWGDRYGQLQDPFGYRWAIATHKEDQSPEEMKKRQDQFFVEMMGQK